MAAVLEQFGFDEAVALRLATALEIYSVLLRYVSNSIASWMLQYIEMSTAILDKQLCMQQEKDPFLLLLATIFFVQNCDRFANLPQSTDSLHDIQYHPSPEVRLFYKRQ